MSEDFTKQILDECARSERTGASLKSQKKKSKTCGGESFRFHHVAGPFGLVTQSIQGITNNNLRTRVSNLRGVIFS